MGYESFVADAPAMEALGARLARCLAAGLFIYLEGDLGSGKTTLTRGVLRELGHRGAVRSPTYTLVEPYVTTLGTVYHFDLYRLADPEELEFLGVRDLFAGEALCLVEWPERGKGILPRPDLVVHLAAEGEGRRLRAEAASRRGEAVLTCLAAG